MVWDAGTNRGSSVPERYELNSALVSKLARLVPRGRRILDSNKYGLIFVSSFCFTKYWDIPLILPRELVWVFVTPDIESTFTILSAKATCRFTRSEIGLSSVPLSSKSFCL